MIRRLKMEKYPNKIPWSMIDTDALDNQCDKWK